MSKTLNIAHPLRLALAYALLGVLWVMGSDLLLPFVAAAPAVSAELEQAKGLIFILITSVLLYFLLTRYSPPKPLTEVSPLPGARRLVLLITLLVMVVPALLFVVSRVEAPHLEVQAYNDLSAIAELKSTQVTNWLDERHSDGMSLSEDPSFMRDVAAAMDSNGDDDWETVRQRLTAFLNAYDYRAVSLLDPLGNNRLQVGVEPTETDAHRLDAPTHRSPHMDLVRNQELSDPNPIGHEFIHHSHDDQSLHLHFVFALRLSPAEAPIATLQMAVKPEQFLFPYINRWSTASPSGETLIAEASGEHVVFISPLRHKEARPGSLTRPLSENTLPAAVALRSGGSGIFQGADYRGVDVLAAYHPIEGTGWQLIAKIDHSEVMAPLYTLVTWVGLIALLAITLIGALLLRMWQQQQRVGSLTLEAERHKTDTLLQQFFDLPFVGIAITSPQSKQWLRFNERLCEIFGYPREELANMSWAELTHADDLDADLAEFDKVMRGESDGYSMDKRYIRKDGSVVDAYIDVKCIRKADGSVDYFVAMVQDIGERKAAEQRLSDSETRFRAVFDTVNDGILLADVEAGRFAMSNTAIEQMLGYSGEELKQLGLEDIHPAESLDDVRDEFRRQLQGEKTLAKDIPVLRRDGSVFTVEISAAPVTINGRRYMVGAFRDITERLQVEKQVRDSLKLLDFAIEQIPIPVIIASAPDVTITYINHAAKALLAKPVDDPRTIPLDKHREYWPTFDPDGTPYQIKDLPLTRAIQGGETTQGEEIIVRHQEGEHWIVASAAPLQDESGAIIAGILAFPDITVQKQAQLKIEQARKEVQRYLDIAGVMLVSLDTKGRIQLINRRACETLGYDEEELQGRNWFECCLPEKGREETRAVFDSLLNDTLDGAEYAETPVLTRDGKERIIAWHNTVVRDEQGIIIGTLGSGEDITERKQIEEQLRHQRDELFLAKQILDSHLDNSPVGVIEWNSDFRILHWSDRAETIFGWTEAEVLGKHPSEFSFVFDEDVDQISVIIDNLLSGKQDQYHIINRNYRRDGSIVYTDWYNSALRDEQGQLLSILSLVQDITEQHTAEEELKQRENLLQKTFDILPVGLWFADANGQLLRGNPAGMAIWGGEPLVGREKYGVFKAWRLPERNPIPPDDWALAHTVTEGITVTDELLEIEALDGTHKTILNYTAPVTDEAGNIEGAVVVNLDITERQRVQQELQERVDELNRWYEATLGREERMLELKQEINRLLQQSGQPPRYPSAETDTTTRNPSEEPPA